MIIGIKRTRKRVGGPSTLRCVRRKDREEPLYSKTTGDEKRVGNGGEARTEKREAVEGEGSVDEEGRYAGERGVGGSAEGGSCVCGGARLALCQHGKCRPLPTAQ